MCCALLRCSGVMCAVCGCESIIHKHMHSSLWNLSIIDSASPTVEMVMGYPSLWLTMECEHLGVYSRVKKRLERGWRKTPNVRKEHGAVQCKVQSLSLRLPLSLSNTSLMGFWGKQRSFTHLSPSHSSLSSPPVPSLPLLFLWLHFCHFIFFYSPSLPSSFLPASWLFCSIAKMGPQSVALEPLNCSEWPRQYAHWIYLFFFLSY